MNRNQWADALCSAMGWSPTVRDGIVAQAYGEGSNAANNPLDTTEPWPGATDYNSAGVKNYATTNDGIAATCATLRNGDYPQLLAAGTAGDPAAYVKAVTSSPWGTWSNEAVALNALQQVRDHPAIGSSDVAGTTPTPPEVTDMASPLQANEAQDHILYIAEDGSVIQLQFVADSPAKWVAQNLTAAAGAPKALTT